MIGELVGSYKIIRELGAGAMGQVYLAEHRYLKRQAALKLLARELVDRPDLLERFFLEARATSAIAHPGIVQIFDCEVDPSGRPYIVMELLTGDTLGAAIARKGVLAPLASARLARSLADALDAAHGKGIVHRDLKPENIFVQADPPDSIKLVDFGIAKLAGEFQAQQVHKTRSGAVMGTPIYMSPEQCRDSATIDFRTDIYSLGCVLFEMLTGRPPFMRDNFGDLMVAHLTEPAPDPRTIVATLPAPLAELTGELLRKDPAQRPPNMRAIAERLMGYVARMTTVPGPGGFAPTMAAEPPAPAPVPQVMKSTFGGSASEVASADDVGVRPTRSKAPLIAAVVLLAGGALGATLFFKAKAPAPVSATATAAAAALLPPTTAAPLEPATAPKSPPPTTTAVSLEAARREKKTAHRGSSPAAAPKNAATPTPTAPPPPPPATEEHRAAPAAVAAVTDFTGNWEGPWHDAAHNQHGRLFLQVSPGGAVSGWMTNTSAKLSYRMVGRFTPAGLDLTCQCPPAQAFVARGGVRPDEQGELKGDFSLSSTVGVFGQARLTLRRTSATR